MRQRAASPVDVRVGDRTVRMTSPDRVLYPATGTMKAEVLAYYVQAAPAMLPHLAGRPVTRKRWPDGVNGPSFFAKDVDPGTPQWVPTAQVPHEGSTKFYPLIDSAAALAWCAQVSAVELHVPQWRLLSPRGPKSAPAPADEPLVDRVVIDLDPGPGVGLVECARIGLALRDRLGELGQRTVPVTSGSKGLHLYVPMDVPLPAHDANTWARQVASAMVKAFPDLAVDSMTKTRRQGRVLIDWSQNNPSKTTVAPYSLRGRTEPTVAAPRTWDEIADPDLRHLHYREVLDRLAAGVDPLADLHAPVAPQRQAAAAGGRTAAHRTGPDTSATPSRRRAAVRPVVAVRERPAAAETSGSALPPGLAGPVAVTLARAAEQLPGPFAMAGGTRYEVKWDGYRGVLVADTGGAELWSRQRRQLGKAFPELVRAGRELLPPGTVLDGEVCIWSGDRLDFDQLQRRMVTASRVAEHARRHPAAFMAFDLLALRGQDLRDQPWTDRRAALEELAAGWAPPLQLTPVTDDVEQARHWMQLYRPAGVEGIVAKAANGRYTPGQRTWVKVKQRNTIDVIAGAVIGPIEHPTAVIAGLYIDGQMTIVGRTGQLTDRHARLLADQLTAASPDHPWPDRMLANRFSPGRDQVTLTKVEPTLVIEVAADAARQGHGWRHPLRFVRPRTDVTADDLKDTGGIQQPGSDLR